jgi:hypothetical protein
MIDVEEIENKYLIALQALQDIMALVDESWYREDFKDYLKSIQAWSVDDQVRYFLRELKNFPVKKAPEDIFVTNSVSGSEVTFGDLLLFSEDYCTRISDISQQNEAIEKMEVIPLVGEAKCVYITKNNFSFATETPTDRRLGGTELNITIKLENEILELKAAGLVNCNHLLSMYRTYLAQLFPI